MGFVLHSPRHESTHRGDKLYEWKECGKVFHLSKALRKHGRKHTVEKPYDVSNVGKPSVVLHILEDIKEDMMERSLMSKIGLEQVVAGGGTRVGSHPASFCHISSGFLQDGILGGGC